MQWARINAKLFIFLSFYNICLLLLSLKIAKFALKNPSKSLVFIVDIFVRTMVVVVKVDWLDSFDSTFASVMRKGRATLELIAVRFYIIY